MLSHSAHPTLHPGSSFLLEEMGLGGRVYRELIAWVGLAAVVVEPEMYSRFIKLSLVKQ
jgi:hypothetical protein